jgi:flagellar biosynthesis regulator FlbT
LGNKAEEIGLRKHKTCWMQIFLDIKKKFIKFVLMILQSPIVNEIADYVDQMSEQQQKALLNVLKKEAIIKEAYRLDKSVKKNNVTMNEIVAIVKDVRKKRYNAGKQIRS